MVKLDYIKSLLWIHSKNPPRDIVVTLVATFWKKPQWVAQGHAGHMEGGIVKEPRGFFQRVAQGCFDGFFYNVSPMSPQVTLWSHQWPLCESNHNVSPGGMCDWIEGHFQKVISMPPLGKVWTNCLKKHNVISMYPPVNWPLSPSGSPHHWSHANRQLGSSPY